MEFILFRFFALLSVAFVASHAAVSTEDYWRSVLPNTPMPKSISTILPSSFAKSGNKGKPVNVGVKPNSPLIYAASADQHTRRGGGVKPNSPMIYAASADQHTRRGGGVKPNSPLIYAAPADQHTRRGGGVKPNSPLIYAASADQHTRRGSAIAFTYADSTDQVYDDTNASLFFLEKDLHQGTNMNIHFTKSTTPTPFLPRNVADSIPFSSKKLPEILTKFSIKENTLESKAMTNTIDVCEAPGIEGEEKYCATSLENMIDFTISKLGKKVNAVSTDVKEESKMQKYRIVGLKLLGEQAVICHKQDYAYAVFYCHKTNKVKAYTVLLLKNDGTKAKAAAICHPDTASWNPKHLAFQVLNVKPGTVSVCHFLPEDHVVWVPY